MNKAIADLLASAEGVRLDQSRYEQDFGAILWQVAGADCWKLERMQNYAETGFPSWEAFMAGRWSEVLSLYEEERSKIVAFHQEFRRHRAFFYRVRVIVEPITPYVQWELHCLRLRAECGERIRIIDHAAVAPFELTGPLPELVSLNGRVLYHTFYGEAQEPNGAIRYADQDLVAEYERFAADLYDGGEEIESYFRRKKIADLPPPRVGDPGAEASGGPAVR